MKQKLFSIYDKKMALFSAPYVADNLDVFIRSLKQIYKKGMLQYDFRQDFALYEIGSFDDSKGTLEAGIPTIAIELADVFRDDYVQHFDGE